MILYTACNKNYFDIYFDLWANAANRVYPHMRKYIALDNPTDTQLDKCIDNKIQPMTFDLRHKRSNESDEEYRGLLYLLRWQYLPYFYDGPILETQINCIAIRPMQFPEIDVEHVRISRTKRGELGGLSAAIFTSSAAVKIVNHANTLYKQPPIFDNVIDEWMAKNLTWKRIPGEQQFSTKNASLDPDTSWITARSSLYMTHDKKLDILNHYLGAV